MSALLLLTDERNVSEAVMSIQRRHGRVGFPYGFDQRELRAIRKRPRSDTMSAPTVTPTTAQTTSPTASAIMKTPLNLQPKNRG